MATTMPSSESQTEVASVASFVRDVWSLGKPRLSSLVIFTTGGGLFLAGGNPHWWVILSAILGTAMVVAAANTLNNYIERDSDRLMSRTRSRPLPAGRLDPRIALVYGLVLAAISIPWLMLSTNLLAGSLAGLALVVYVLIYTPLKRKSWTSVWIGGVAGAMPPLIGWTAVTGSLDPGGMALFCVLFLWQLPHSLAIQMYRKTEYAQAGIKILPIEMNDAITRQQMMAYCVGLVAVTLWLVHLGLGGMLTLAGALSLGSIFIFKIFKGIRHDGGAVWARDLFLYSLVYLSGLFIVMAIDHTL